MEETQAEQIQRVEDALLRRVEKAIFIVEIDDIPDEVKESAWSLINYYLKFQLTAKPDDIVGGPPKPDDTPGGMTSHERD